MAIFQITLDDTLVPGIIATANLEGKEPEIVVQEYANALANKTCQDLKVGPYYTGPIPPQFNQDGTPYVAPPVVEEPIPVVQEDETILTDEEVSVVEEPATSTTDEVILDEPTPEETPIVEEVSVSEEVV